jgi:DNA-directed RNA polymerase subunit beta'
MVAPDVKDGDKVKRGTRWRVGSVHPPDHDGSDGEVEFEDVVDGVSVRKSPTKSTGITNARHGHRLAFCDRVARISSRRSRSRARMAKSVKLPRGGDARYLLSVDAILSVADGDIGRSRRRACTCPTESGAKTKDITGGLPRVAELFEARRPKDHAIIAESGRSSTAATTRTSVASRSLFRKTAASQIEYLIPKGKHLPFRMATSSSVANT